MIDRGGQTTCAPSLAGDGLCPDGMYFDSQYGACASPALGADVPYGLNLPEQASDAYAVCQGSHTRTNTSAVNPRKVARTRVVRWAAASIRDLRPVSPTSYN